MVEPGVRVDRAELAPREPAVRRLGELDVVFAVPIVLPRDVEMVVLCVLGRDPRIVVRADVRAGDALLRAATEVALRFADEEVVADLDRRRAVEVGRSGDRVAGRVTMHCELLSVRVARGRVAVVERDLEVAVRQHDRVRALIEVAVICACGRAEEVAEAAEGG
jgi:hypothetical protein